MIFKEFYEMADTINPPPSKGSSDNLYHKIIEEDYALVEWNDNLDLIMKAQHKITGKCDFQLSTEKFLTQRLAFAFPKDNPWIEKFNKE